MAQVKNLEIAITVEQFGTTVYTDAMNMTRVWINDVECEPDEDGAVIIPTVKPGDFIKLDTRRSSWWGTVTRGDGVISVAVEAEGHFESVRGGLSGLLTWNIRSSEYATVESSLHSEPVRWDIYTHTKAAANCAASELGNEQRDEIWSELLTICAKTAVFKPLPEWWGMPKIKSASTLALSAEDIEILGESTLAKLRLSAEDSVDMTSD